MVSLGAAALACSVATSSVPIIQRELTPADSVATVRVMENNPLSNGSSGGGAISPDGRRYLIRLAHGDVKRNGVWLDLLTGRLDSLDTASHPIRCAHLFTTGFGSSHSPRSADDDADPANIVSWISPTQVAFLWSDSQTRRQVISVDLKSCQHRFLTNSPTDVFSFALAPNGTLLYNAQIAPPPSPARQLWHRGFTLNEATTGWSVLHGDIDGTDPLFTQSLNAWFIQSKSAIRPVNFGGSATDRSIPIYRELTLSPTGRYAVIGVAPRNVPDQWKLYKSPPLQLLLESNLNQSIQTRVGYALVDLYAGVSRALWNAPKGLRGQVSWSAINDRVLLAPTFLPLEASGSNGAHRPSPQGLTGAAAAVVDVANGEYEELPIDLTNRTVVSLQWLTPRDIEIASSDALGADLISQHFIHTDARWVTATAPLSTAIPSTPQIRLETRQDLNHPPRIFAVDSTTGESRLILDPNPHLLEQFRLGRVERLSGYLSNGKQWLGQLIYPANYQPSHRYPLVIQSLYGAGFGAEEFSLDGSWLLSGMGLGPSAFAAYPGQLLATRGIAVLQLGVLHSKFGLEEAQDNQLAYETLAEQLTASGLADRNKIALDGFSRNGYWVDYTLTHTQFPFAAAVAADNWEPSYFQATLLNWRRFDEEANGAPAFGAGLDQWLAQAPGFNAEHIQTPLRMVLLSDGAAQIIGEWEIYSRLKHLNKPVEMAIMPDGDIHPSHTPQNPSQIMAVQDGVIDWFSFWLTGREDPDPQKRDQYNRWRAFRAAGANSASGATPGPSGISDSGTTPDPQL